jgi:Tfp pilus assembly protein FimT
MQNASRQAGNTLIEMMVIVSILGLVLLAGAPRMAGYVQGQKLARGLDDLASSMDLARQRAITENHAYRVVLSDPSDEEYWLHSDANGNGVLDTGEVQYGPFSLPGGVTFSALNLLGDQQLVFLNSGMLRAGEGGTVILADARGLTRTLEVFGSGLVTVQ